MTARWYRLVVAAQGNADAQYNLGILYEDGYQCAEAVKWYREAAHRGLGDAVLRTVSVLLCPFRDQPVAAAKKSPAVHPRTTEGLKALIRSLGRANRPGSRTIFRATDSSIRKSNRSKSSIRSCASFV